MIGLNRKVNSATTRWLIVFFLSLIVTGCTYSRPLPVDNQDIDLSYRYAVPPRERDGWQTQSLEASGISERPLAALVSRIRDNTFPLMHSVLLIKDGMLVFEEYFSGYHRYHVNEMHSVSKSVTSILVGIAVDHGFVGLDDPVHTYFDDYRGLKWIDQPYGITINNLLTMTHGTDWDERSRPLSDPKNSIRAMVISEDWLGFTLNHNLIEPPGRRYNYAGGMTVLLGEIVSRASGQDLGGFAEKYLFQPLGIHIEGWDRSRLGIVNAQGGLLLRPRDMAKIGQLMLNNGTWQGKRIVSEAWVVASLENYVTAENGWGYGYQWRLGQTQIDDHLIDLFFAAGRGGQHIIVVPSLHLVAVFTTQPIDNPGGENRNLIIMSEYILPAVTGIKRPQSEFVSVDRLADYQGHYVHKDTGHMVKVVIDGTDLSISPSFWRRIRFSPIDSDTFFGYTDLGYIHARFLRGPSSKADKIIVRFLFGKRIYERI